MAGKIRWSGWALGCLLMGLLLVLATLPPFVSPEWRLILMQAFAPVCHQIAERSYHVDGISLAVCHRCYGIYWGLFLGPILYLAVRRWERVYWAHARLLLVAGLLPLGIDWMLNAVGLWQNTSLSRALTGAAFGLTAGLLVAQAMASLTASRPPPE